LKEGGFCHVSVIREIGKECNAAPLRK
jgi:hypothetical protein